MTTLHCDVAVIGAGTAGIAAERSAREQGAKTLLIDDRFAGTTCATVGCMPSKLLIAAADTAHGVRRAAIFGIRTSNPVVDGAAVMQRLRQERERFASGARDAFPELPEGTCIKARARFVNATTLLLDDGLEVQARAVVIATGSTPSIPQAFQSVEKFVLTNETIFELPQVPKSVAVIGAGPLGLELAQALCRLGTDTKVFDESQQLSWIPDKTVANDVLGILEKEFPILLGVRLEATKEGEGVRLTWAGNESGSEYFDHLLLAAGRPPALSGLNLAATEIALDEHGSPRYDPNSMQCDGSSIFIAGDADHDRPQLHEATAEGTLAGRNAATYPTIASARRFTPLSITFTDPPVAIVGDIAKVGAEDVVTGPTAYEDQGRARVFARNAGTVHLYADAHDGRLLGASMVGPGIEHVAHLVAWAIQLKMTADRMLAMPFYHPTYEEGLKPALRSICRAVRSSLDGTVPPGE